MDSLDLKGDYSQTKALSAAPVQYQLSLTNKCVDAFPEVSDYVYQEVQRCLEQIWEELRNCIPENPFVAWLQESQTRVLHLSLVLLTNTEIQLINHLYRQKDQATDVLTFNLVSAHEELALFLQLPEIDLGEVYVSVEWAVQHQEEGVDLKNKEQKAQLMRFVMMRVIHGHLHLLGMHHDTQEQYNTVVAIQNRILDKL